MKTRSGTAGLVAAMLIFGTIGLFRRFISLSSPMLACCRGILGAVFLAVFAGIKGETLCGSIGTRRRLLLMVSGAAIGVNWILLFEAYNYTTVATATLCYYMQPTIVVLLSPLVFREKLTLRKGLCALAAAGGMVLVSGLADGGAAGGDMRGVLFGLGAAALYAFVVMLNKKLTGIGVYEKTVWQLGTAAAAALPYMLLSGSLPSEMPGVLAIIMVLITGIVHTGFAYALYFASLEKLPAQSAALLSYIDPVTALLLSAAFLHEPLTVAGAVGAVLILGAAMLSEWKKD